VEWQEVCEEEMNIDTIRALVDRYGDWCLTVRCHRQLKKRSQGNGEVLAEFGCHLKTRPVAPFLQCARGTFVRCQAQMKSQNEGWLLVKTEAPVKQKWNKILKYKMAATTEDGED
jgi:hypothetical protein